MSRAILEANIRAFVAKGSNIDRSRVRRGFDSQEPPAGLYASVSQMSERRLGQPARIQQIGENNSVTYDVNSIEALFDIQWYRDGALEAAYRFHDWACSESGITWAATAITDGRIAGCNIYAGGSGYQSGDGCVFTQQANDPAPTMAATGSLTTNAMGEATGVLMTSDGFGYWDMPVVSIASNGGNGAVTSPRGHGFAVRYPMQVSNLTAELAADYEERAQIDLRIVYDRGFTDIESGRVEEIKGDYA